MPHPLGLELLTVLGLGPVEHIHLAAELGCKGVSMALLQVPASLNPHNYPAWSLRDDPVLRREVKAVLRDTGVVMALAEGFNLSRKDSAQAWAADMDSFAEFGALRVNAVDMGTPEAQALEDMAMLADMANQRGMGFTIEFCPEFTIHSLPMAVQFVQKIGTDHAQILIDSMHFFRSGGTIRDIAELDPAVIGYVQLSDAPKKAQGDYLIEAMTGRMIPGQGELPLREFVHALPRGQMIGLEVPLLAAAQSGRDAKSYVSEIVRRTREFLL